MSFFEKKLTIFKEKDKPAWERARRALKDAQIPGVRAGSYEDEPPICGCGSKLDPRNFGPRGKIDRRVYYIDVPVSVAESAKRVVENAAGESGKE